MDELAKQVTPDCEIVISDNASTDSTELIVQEYARILDRIRYFRQALNVGVDRNIDNVVTLASGEYCWLMADDDMVKAGAIRTILTALHDRPSLVIANVEYRDSNLSRIIKPRGINIDVDRYYESHELDRLFLDAGTVITFIGSIIIKKSIWVEREREKYYGTCIIHIGVIFQTVLPSRALVIAKPIMVYRCGNSHSAELTNEAFKICAFQFPAVINDLAFSDAFKRNFPRTDQLPSLRSLLQFRALGWYTVREYRECIRSRVASMIARFLPLLIAVLPGMPLNAIYLLCYRFTDATDESALIVQHLRESRFYARRFWST